MEKEKNDVSMINHNSYIIGNNSELNDKQYNNNGKSIETYQNINLTFDSLNIKKPYIYLIGGRSRGKTLSKIERYSIIENKWEDCINLNDARGSTAACGIAPFIYVMGGGGIKSNLSTCEKLNTSSNKWEKLDDISIARHALSACNSDTCIYLIGGWIAGTISSKNVELFDIEKNAWKQLESLIVPRRLHAVVYLANENKIFIFGGQTNLGVIDDVECYFINENKWEVKKSLPMAGCTQAVVISGIVYVLIMPKCIFKYDYINDNYEKVENGDYPLEEWYGFSAVAYMDKVFVLGGTSKGRYCDDVFSFDVKKFTWEKLQNMRFARRRSSAVFIEA